MTQRTLPLGNSNSSQWRPFERRPTSCVRRPRHRFRHGRKTFISKTVILHLERLSLIRMQAWISYMGLTHLCLPLLSFDSHTLVYIFITCQTTCKLVNTVFVIDWLSTRIYAVSQQRSYNNVPLVSSQPRYYINLLVLVVQFTICFACPKARPSKERRPACISIPSPIC